MASVEIAQVADGDLQIAAEDGRVVLKGQSFYFALSDDDLKALCNGLMAAAVATLPQLLQRKISEQLAAKKKAGEAR